MKMDLARMRLRVRIAVCGVLWAGGAYSATWTGGGADGAWSTPDNWGGSAPVSGDALLFAGTQRTTNANDLAAGTLFSGLTFDASAGPFLLSGNGITLGGSIVNNGTLTQYAAMPMVLNETRTLNAAAGSFILQGALSGPGGLSKTGANIAVLTGDNTYEGVTAINNGIVRITHARALGSPLAGTTMVSPNRLELAGNITVTGETVTVVGKGGNNNGALQVQAGSNTWAGSIIIGSSDARFGVLPSNGTLVLDGPISDGGNGWPLIVRCADAGGPVVVTGTNNTYGGETQVVVGTVKAGGDNRFPTGTVIRVGNSSNVAYATFDVNGFDQTVKGIAAEGTIMACRITNTRTNQAVLTVNNATPYTFAGTLEGSLSLTKAGAARLTLTAASNTYTGVTAVCEGELYIDKPWCLLNSTVDTGEGPMGTLAFGTNTVINVGGLTGLNNLVLTNAAGKAVTLRVRGAQHTEFNGQILNGCDFEKTGTGTFIMHHANSYTGRTHLLGGTVKVASEACFGVEPATAVTDRIIFDGGMWKADTNFVLAASNRGITLAAGGGTLSCGDRTTVFTCGKPLAGAGGLTTRGTGVVLLTQPNTYAGVTTVKEGSLRVSDAQALGTVAGGTVVESGAELSLTHGLTVSGEWVTISGNGIVAEPPPPSAPNTNRGALQSAANATAEWAGPVLLGANQARVGAQLQGHLIISGVIDDGAATYALRTSSDPNSRTRGVEFRAQNTYGGSTDLTRGTLFLGVDDALPTGSVLDVHWAGSNNGEYAGLDMAGFDQTVSALRNSGISGNAAAITNSGSTLSTLTLNQTVDTVYAGTIGGAVSVVKAGGGRLTLVHPTHHTGDTAIQGGTLELGANNVLSSQSAVVLSGGQLALGATTNTLASLTVTADSTLDLGEGQAVFAAQTPDVWEGTLTLTGTLTPTSVRTQPLLTPAQLASVRYQDAPVSQNADGYLTEYRGTLIWIE